MNPLVRALRAVVKLLIRAVFSVRVIGLEHYQAAGPRVLIVANHVSLLDGVLFYLFFPDRPTFAINTAMAHKRLFKPFLALVDLFALDPTNPLSTKALIKFLRQDRKAVIFPEGRITVTGSLMKVYEGTGMVADRAEATILPVGIEGAQYTPFGYLNGRVRIGWFPRITLRFLPPVHLQLSAELRGHERRQAAARALLDVMLAIGFANCDPRTTLFEAVIAAMQRHGAGAPVLEDTERAPVSFRQLLLRAFIVGRLLDPLTRRGERVGVLMPNVVGTIAVLFGLHTRGRVPAMLNFSAGPQTLVLACETAGIDNVLTSRRFVAAAGLQAAVETLSQRVRVVYLEDLRGQVTPAAKLLGLACALAPRRAYARLNPCRDPDAEAVVLFTSGSEGVPKGVVLSHANLLANRAQMRWLVDLTARDTVFNCMPVFHSFGLTGGVLLPLLDGARVFLYPTPLHYRLIPELCYELSATILFGSNTFLAGYARYAHPYDFYSMRFVVAGAEKLQEDTRRTWLEKFGIRVFEGYGATEASPVIAVNWPMAVKTGTVGRLLSGIEHYLEPVEGIAEGGRLVIRGPNVMKGYLFHGHDRLVPPWTERAGAGWYDTGDVVRMDAQGYVTIIGRGKRFAKVGGEMVSLTTVEELARATWPNAIHAAVAIEDPRRGEQIILVTEYAAAERRPLIDTARRAGYSELTVPRQILTTTQVPVLGTGKVDYRAVLGLVRAPPAPGPQ